MEGARRIKRGFLRGVGGDAATEPHKTGCWGYPEEEFSGTPMDLNASIFKAGETIRRGSTWIVEISAVSDLRPRGQWPQGHINADWTTCERRQAGCAPDLRQDFRAGGLGAAQFWPGNHGCRITTSVRFQEKQRYSSGVNP